MKKKTGRTFWDFISENPAEALVGLFIVCNCIALVFMSIYGAK